MLGSGIFIILPEKAYGSPYDMLIMRVKTCTDQPDCRHSFSTRGERVWLLEIPFINPTARA
jgi:hypothetical protein